MSVAICYISPYIPIHPRPLTNIFAKHILHPRPYSSSASVRELEKKFSDKHVLFVGQRRILKKPTRNARVGQKRPMSRTLTMVHEKLLEDLVYPTEIVGKRTRFRVDGSRLIKV